MQHLREFCDFLSCKCNFKRGKIHLLIHRVERETITQHGTLKLCDVSDNNKLRTIQSNNDTKTSRSSTAEGKEVVRIFSSFPQNGFNRFDARCDVVLGHRRETFPCCFVRKNSSNINSVEFFVDVGRKLTCLSNNIFKVNFCVPSGVDNGGERRLIGLATNKINEKFLPRKKKIKKTFISSLP